MRKQTSHKTLRALIGFNLVVLCLATFTPTALAIPSMDVHEICARARTAINGIYRIDYRYNESWFPWGDTPLGADAWSTYGHGVDCSGLVLKCWQVPQTLVYPQETPGPINFTRYTASNFYYDNTYWFLAGSTTDVMQRGDCIATPSHVFIFDKYNYLDGKINPYYVSAYEASSGEGKVWYNEAAYLASGYRVKRRLSLDTVNQPYTIKLDNPSCAFYNSSLTYPWRTVWPRNSAPAGFIGTDYSYIYGNLVSYKALAKWTPVIITPGYYHIYVKWAPESVNATNAKYVVNHKNGTLVRYRDQRDPAYVNTWSQLTTTGSVPFNPVSGYSTAYASVDVIARDPALAYTANGRVIADGIKFVFDRPADW